ncbi:unnamed protein product [Chrysoparadoxa australica]
MGRRKSTTKKIKQSKKKAIDKVFKCPFCSHDKTVQCKLNHKDKQGTVRCRICDTSYSTNINYLTEEIDVYTEWLDACEAENAANEDEYDDA